MLVEGEKLKELDEEEGIKIQREQRKIKLGEEGGKELKGTERKESLRGVGRPGTGSIIEVSRRKCSGSRRRREEGEAWVLLRFLGFLVIYRSSFSGKLTSQAANGSNSEWRYW